MPALQSQGRADDLSGVLTSLLVTTAGPMEGALLNHQDT